MLQNFWWSTKNHSKTHSFCFLGDQLDGQQLHVPAAGLNDSQSDGNITQDEIIDYGNQDDQDNLQLSALQEYFHMIDNEDEESDDETWQTIN